MMPDDVAQACHDGEGVDASAIHGYQSVWVAHWMHTSCRSAAPNRNQLSVGCAIKEVKEGNDDAEKPDLLGGSDVAVDGSVCDALLGEVDKDSKLTFINEADCGKSKKPSFGSKSFPIFNVSQKTGGILSLKREWDSVKSETKSSSGDDGVSLYRTGSHLPSTSAHVPPKTETSVRKCQPLSQGILPRLVKTPTATEQNELAVSTSVWNDAVKSDSAVVPSVRDKGKGLMSPLKSEQRQIYQSSFNLASQEHFTTTKYHSFSSLSIREKKTSSLLDPQRSSFSRWIQSDISHLPQDPMDSSDDELCFVQGPHHKIHNLIDNANITNHIASLESTKAQKSCGGSSLVPQLLQDVETMKIYTSIDAVEESLRGDHPKISQTAHHFLMSKKADVNLSNRGQLVRESIAPTKLKVNSFSANLDFSSPMSDHAMEDLKLEALGSSIKCDGKENVQDIRSLKNESSAETDTMDIHALHANHLPGDVPLLTNKYSKDSQNLPPPLVAKTSARENAKSKSLTTALPDMNQEPHEELTPTASPVVDKETSTSRTNSLGVEHLLSHADKHFGSKSGDTSLGPNPCGRWVKRLKLCTFGSAHGTKNENLGECSSHEKVNNIVTTNMEGTNPIMEPKVIYHAEEQMVPDVPDDRELTNGKSSLNEAKSVSEITLSHPWIQRWNHPSSASFPKSQLHDPKSSNTEAEDLQKEQFPSIAAMALMGKAMNSLNPSQVMKKGPVIVWNAKGF